MATSIIPLIVVVGPTASGKTALAIEIAQKYNGEIICADSRTVYKELDIGTAKPTPEEQLQAKHHLIDLVYPDQAFTLADFQRLAIQAIEDVRRRGKTPILVGGSGLYIDSVIFDYRLGSTPDPSERQKLEALSIEELKTYCKKNSINLPENHNNKRYLIRAIEQKGVNDRRRDTIIHDCLVVGISTEKSILDQRIQKRADIIFAKDGFEEAMRVGKKYSWEGEALTGNLYRVAHMVCSGRLPGKEAKHKFVILDRQLAKKQRTWFRRNKDIHWGDPNELKNTVRLYLERHKT